MTTETLPAVVGRDASAIEVLERVITTGDLGRLTPQERVALYARTCESLGLNPLTRPFEYITLNSKLTLYVRKDATDQLRRLHRVSVDSVTRDKDDALGLLTVNAAGHTPDGRRDESTGVMSIKGLSGEALANAVMKAETKAKRRLTLSLVGLGFLDESEIEGAERSDVDPDTGEIREAPAKPATLLEAVAVQQARLEAPASTSATPVEVEPGGPEPEMTWPEFRQRMAARNLTAGKVKTAAEPLFGDRVSMTAPDKWELEPVEWARLADALGI